MAAFSFLTWEGGLFASGLLTLCSSSVGAYSREGGFFDGWLIRGFTATAATKALGLL